MTTTVPEAPDTTTTEARQLVDGLLALAAFVEANPDLATFLKYSFKHINVPHLDSRGEAKEFLATFARAGMRGGATVSKNFDTKWGTVELAFSPSVSLHVYADRAEVCERVVTGTREVVEEVPDPQALAAVPKVTVTKVVEDVEWVCSPLLAEAGADR